MVMMRNLCCEVQNVGSMGHIQGSAVFDEGFDEGFTLQMSGVLCIRHDGISEM